jgi:phosphatidylglycerophosphate synthase
VNREFRTKYEARTLVLGRICARVGLSPNILTVISLVVGALSGFAYGKQRLGTGVFLLIMAAFIDILDGSTARASGRITKFGTILDMVFDRYAEFFILLGILLSGYVKPWCVLLGLFGMIIASYTRATAESKGGLNNAAVGLVGRLEKFLILIIGTLFQIYFPWGKILEYSVILVGIISTVTALQRLFYAMRMLKE